MISQTSELLREKVKACMFFLSQNLILKPKYSHTSFFRKMKIVSERTYNW